MTVTPWLESSPCGPYTLRVGLKSMGLIWNLPGDRKRIVGHGRPYLQFQKPRHATPKRHRFALRLGRGALPLEAVFIGLAGYAYQQITDDSGQNPSLGGFRSRVLGVGPQIGYVFPLGDMRGFLGLRGYGDFDAANRASGWSTWLTFAISPEAPTAVTPTRHLVTK